jgi:outer membrane immunogenic protein
MKRLLLASVAVGALMTAANAADLPRKAPMMAPAALPVLSWTGCYVGGNVGGGWGKNDVTQTASAPGLGTLSAGFSGRATTGVDTSGAVFGGQIGCDYQFANQFVIGIQGMLDGSTVKGSEFDAFAALLPGAPVGTIDVKTKWFGSVTGRLGYAFLSQNEALIYIKGGGAWARYETNLNNLTTSILFPGSNPGTIGKTFTGWTIGGGFEYRFARNWSAFIEYNYYDFGERTIWNAAGGGLSGNLISLDPKLQTVTVGVNYRFWTP